jgi:hypothetical protein
MLMFILILVGGAIALGLALGRHNEMPRLRGYRKDDVGPGAPDGGFIPAVDVTPGSHGHHGGHHSAGSTGHEGHHHGGFDSGGHGEGGGFDGGGGGVVVDGGDGGS